jgi:ABC-2 type transport system permease protein
MKSALSFDAVDLEAVANAPAVPSGGFGLTTLWTLYVLTLRQHLHGKRWMIMGVLFLLPAGLAVLIRATVPVLPNEKPEFTLGLEFSLAFMLIPQALLPLAALLYATGVIEDELEEQTITYLLIRPISKWALYLVKMLATVTTTVLLTIVFTVLTYLAIFVGGDTPATTVLSRCFTAVSIHCTAVCTYSCLFGLISLLTKRSLIGSVLYILVFEWLLGNLPLAIRLITVIYYARLIAYRTLTFVLSVQGETHDLAAHVWRLDIKSDPNLLEHPQLATCWIVLAAGSVAFTLLAAFLCSRREFYVKTPEKG